MTEDLKLGMARVPTPRCWECGKTGTVIVQMSDYLRWTSERLPLQNAFPTLSAELRQQILTGTHPECWEKMFPPEVEEECICTNGHALDGGACETMTVEELGG